MFLEPQQELFMGQSNSSVDQDKSTMENASQDPRKTVNGHQNNLEGENTSIPSKAPPQSQNDAPSTSAQEYPESVMNLSLLDPPQWGWTAVGGVADVLTPHERSRRRSTTLSYRKEYQRCRRRSGTASRGAVSYQRQNSLNRMNGITQQHGAHSTSSTSQIQQSVTLKAPPPSSLEKTVNQDNVQTLEQANFSVPNPLSALSDANDPPPKGNTSQQSTTEAMGSISANELPQKPQAKEVETTNNDATQAADNSQTESASAEPCSTALAASLADIEPSPDTASAVATVTTVQKEQTAETRLLPQASTAAQSMPPPTPRVDTGIKLVGVPSDLLGVTIQKHVAKEGDSTADKTAEGKNQRRGSTKGQKYDCVVHSLGKATADNDSCGVEPTILDMYAYHRGREGMEARDKECGELLCASEATDTNHDLDAPKSKFSLEIQFPLSDDEETDSTYKEMIDWDLSDPSTPSPLGFATAIACEYGLALGAKMDLADSIEQQIEAHLTAQYQYSEPITLKDPSGISEKNRAPGPIVEAFQYGSAVENGKQGHSKPSRLCSSTRSRSGISSSVDEQLYERSGSVASDTDSVVSRNTTSNHRRRSSVESGGTSERDDATDAGNDVEEMYFIEMKQRARKASALDILAHCQDGVAGELELVRNGVCHICHKRAEMTYLFACREKNHSYCKYHVSSRLGIENDLVCDFCPICSLTCECAKCVRKAILVTTIFKGKCLEQSAAPAEAEFPEVFDLCKQKHSSVVRDQFAAATQAIQKSKIEELESQRIPTPSAPSVEEFEDKPAVTHPRTSQKKDELMVPKPPLSHFPIEMANNTIVEIGTPDDYYTIYSSEGPRLSNDLPEDWPKKPKLAQASESTSTKGQDVVDDGSVDYCHYCMKPGDIICCDYCPRAFHSICMKKHSDFNELSPDDKKWECTICKNEKAGLVDDEIVDGKSSMDQICSTFVNVGGVTENFVGFEILSMIHEMVLKLMNYDFGYMFSKPVDFDAVPGYTTIVKKPMDLGTICSKLVNGAYAKELDQGSSIDDVVTMALEDIELVWHNCFSYNTEGSAVCRMAEVLRKRANRIRRRSFNGRLSTEVKKELESFVGERERFRSALQSAKLADERRAEIESRKPRSKHRVQVTSGGQTNSKHVAVLDPATGRIVLTYSTAKNAAHAVQVLLGQGHRCEWNAKLGLNMRLIAQRSASDPSMLLFGYRWLFLEDLRSNKVAFFRLNPELVEMRYKECTFLFNSVEEALSSSDLPKETILSQLSEFLKSLPPGQWEEFAEMQWRRPQIRERREKSYLDDDDANNADNALKVKTHSSNSREDDDSWQKCAVVKRDLISGRNLVGFQNPSAAYDDWVQTTLASPTFPDSESRTVQYFEKHYLDGNRNVDGLVWRTNQSSDGSEPARLQIIPVSVKHVVSKSFLSNGEEEGENRQGSFKKRKRTNGTNGIPSKGAQEASLLGNDNQNKRPKVSINGEGFSPRANIATG